MAETKKKTTSKSTATKKSAAKKVADQTVELKNEAGVENTEVVTPIVAEPVTVKIPEKKVYQASDMILCKSVRYGTLHHVSKKSGDMYEWADYGDEVPVAYGDLLALKSRKSKFLYAPWFLILDDQLVEEWKLADIYSYYEDFEDVEDFLQAGAITLRRKLPNAPQGYKDLIVHKAGEMIRHGTLDSIATIKAIDDILGKNLMDMLGGN